MDPVACVVGSQAAVATAAGSQERGKASTVIEQSELGQQGGTKLLAAKGAPRLSAQVSKLLVASAASVTPSMVVPPWEIVTRSCQRSAAVTPSTEVIAGTAPERGGLLSCFVQAGTAREPARQDGDRESASQDGVVADKADPRWRSAF